MLVNVIYHQLSLIFVGYAVSDLRPHYMMIRLDNYNCTHKACIAWRNGQIIGKQQVPIQTLFKTFINFANGILPHVLHDSPLLQVYNLNFCL